MDRPPGGTGLPDDHQHPASRDVGRPTEATWRRAAPSHDRQHPVASGGAAGRRQPGGGGRTRTRSLVPGELQEAGLVDDQACRERSPDVATSGRGQPMPRSPAWRSWNGAVRPLGQGRPLEVGRCMVTAARRPDPGPTPPIRWHRPGARCFAQGSRRPARRPRTHAEPPGSAVGRRVVVDAARPLRRPPRAEVSPAFTTSGRAERP